MWICKTHQPYWWIHYIFACWNPGKTIWMHKICHNGIEKSMKIMKIKKCLFYMGWRYMGLLYLKILLLAFILQQQIELTEINLMSQIINIILAVSFQRQKICSLTNVMLLKDKNFVSDNVHQFGAHYISCCWWRVSADSSQTVKYLTNVSPLYQFASKPNISFSNTAGYCIDKLFSQTNKRFSNTINRF